MAITNTLRQDDDLYSLKKKIANLEKTLELMQSNITTQNFESLTAQIDDLSATTANLAALTSDNIAATDLTAVNGTINNLNVQSLNMQNIAVRTDSGAPARMLPIGKIIENGGFIFLKGFANALDPITNLPVANFDLTITYIDKNLTALYDASNENLLESFMIVKDPVTDDLYIVIGTGSELANFNIQGWYQSIEPVLTDVVLSPADVQETLYVDPTLLKSFITKNISVEKAVITNLDAENFYTQGINKVYEKTLTLLPGVNRLSYIDETNHGETWFIIRNGTTIVAEGRVYVSSKESALVQYSQLDQYIDALYLNRYNDGTYLACLPNAIGEGLEIDFWMENMYVADPSIPGTLLQQIYGWVPTVGATAWLEHYQIGSVNADAISVNEVIGVRIPDPNAPGQDLRSKITMDDAFFDTLTVTDIGTENIHQSFNQPVTIATQGWYQLLNLNVMSQGIVYTKATANDGAEEYDTVQISADQVLDFSRGAIIDQAAIDDDYFYIHLSASAVYPVSILTAVNGVYPAASDPTVLTNQPVTLPATAKVSSFIDKIHVSDYLFSDIAIGAPDLRASNSIKTRNVWKCNYDAFNSIDNYPAIDSALNIANQFNTVAGNWYKIFDKADLPYGELTLVADNGNFSYSFRWYDDNDVLTLNAINAIDGLTQLVQVGTACYLYAGSAKTYIVTVNATVANSTTPVNTPVLPFINAGTTDPSGGNAYTIGQINGSLYFGPSGANSFTYIGTVQMQDGIVNGDLTVNGNLLGDFEGIEKTANKDTSIEPTKFWIISTDVRNGGSGYIVGDTITQGTNTYTVASVLAGVVQSLTLTSNALVDTDPAGTDLATTGGTGAGLRIDIVSQQNSGPGRYPTSGAVIDYVANRIIVRVPSQAAFDALVNASNLIPNVTYLYPDSAFTSQIIDDSVTQNNTTWSSVHISAELADILQELQALANSGIYIGHNDFSHVPTPTELTSYVLSMRPEWTDVADGSVVINDFDGHEWRYSAAVWVDLGFTNVSQWSNSSAGLIKGRTQDNANAYNTFGTITAQANGEGRVNNLFLVDKVTYDGLATPKPDGVYIIIDENV